MVRESELRWSDDPAAARWIPTEPAPAAREAWPARLSRIALEVSGGGLLAVESALVLVGVFFRYVLNNPLYWAEEAARLLLIWLSFIGAALAFQRNQHLAMDVVMRLLPEALRLRIQVLVTGAGIAFCLAAIQQTTALMASRWTRVSPVMGAPYLLFALPLAIGLAFGAVYLVVEIARIVPLMEQWLLALQPHEPFFENHALPDQAWGIGLTEAARGALGHWLRIDKGRISHYQIVAPTSWNFSPRDAAGTPGALEAALVGAPLDSAVGTAASNTSVAVQHIVRSFDPCMVCTVH